MITTEQVNQMTFEEFIQTFGNAVENCALAAGAVWSSRPFKDFSDLNNCFSTFIDSQPYQGQLAVLRVHPDLAGLVAQRGSLTTESAAEQNSAQLDSLSEQERLQLSEHNERYKEAFGFPFVICARKNKKEAILSGIATRLQNSADDELRTGLEEVKKICELRLQDIVTTNDNKSQL